MQYLCWWCGSQSLLHVNSQLSEVIIYHVKLRQGAIFPSSTCDLWLVEWG